MHISCSVEFSLKLHAKLSWQPKISSLKHKPSPSISLSGSNGHISTSPHTPSESMSLSGS